MALFQRYFSDSFWGEMGEPSLLTSGSAGTFHEFGNSIHHPHNHPIKFPSSTEGAGGSLRLRLAMQKAMFFILWFRYLGP